MINYLEFGHFNAVIEHYTVKEYLFTKIVSIVEQLKLNQGPLKFDMVLNLGKIEKVKAIYQRKLLKQLLKLLP